MRLIAILFFCLFAQGVLAQQKVTLPKALVEDAFKRAECEIDLDEALEKAEAIGELGGGLKLVEVYCWRAAYNSGSILFALDPAALDRTRHLTFRSYGAKDKSVVVYQLSSPGYDGKNKTLSSFHKGRGVGDCGTSGRWRWNGKDFELRRYWNKDKCDGQVFDVDEYPNRFLVYPPRRKK
jgi:hypothetical protein